MGAAGQAEQWTVDRLEGEWPKTKEELEKSEKKISRSLVQAVVEVPFGGPGPESGAKAAAQHCGGPGPEVEDGAEWKPR